MKAFVIPRTAFSVLAFAFFYLVNPAYLSGCGAEEEEFSFGEQDMAVVLDVANDTVHEATDDDGRQLELELDLVQVMGEESPDLAEAASPSSWMMRARACRSRSFFASAAACDVTSQMALEGTLTLRVTEGGETIELEEIDVGGVLTVNGHDLDNAYLDVHPLVGEGNFSLHSDGVRPFEIFSAELTDVPGADVTISFER